MTMDSRPGGTVTDAVSQRSTASPTQSNPAPRLLVDAGTRTLARRVVMGLPPARAPRRDAARSPEPRPALWRGRPRPGAGGAAARVGLGCRSPAAPPGPRAPPPRPRGILCAVG